MAIPRALLISIVCLFGAAAATAAGPLISSGLGPRRNLTDLLGSRRAFEHVPVPNPVAAALGAAAGAKLKAVLLEAATIASFVSQLPGGHFSRGASKVCEDFGALPACDFYFDLLGPLGLPSLRLPFVSQPVLLDSQRNGDHSVSLNIATSVSPSVHDIGEDKTKTRRYQVEVDAAGKAEYCKCKAAELATSVAHAGDQFYATGEGPANWPENPFSFDWDCMPRRLRADIKAREEKMQRKTMFTVCEGRDVPGSYNGDILVFPEMLIYRSLTRFDVECFVDEALVQEQPRLLWPEPLTGCHIFVCCHVTRESLCGAIGPQVVAKFREEIERRGLIDVHVWPCCHLSRNVSMDACVGNVSVFKRSKPSCNNCGRRRSEDRFLSGARRQQLPPEALAALVAAASAGQTGEVRGDWYGQVMPDDVADVMELHVMGDSVVERLWRGRMGLWPRQQVEEQADRLGSMRCVSADPEASSERTPGSASGSALSDAGSEVCSCAPAAVTRSFSAQFISPQTSRSSSEASKGSNNSPCEFSKCNAGGVAHSPSSTLDAVNRLRSASFHSCSSASYSSTSIASADPAVSDVRGEVSGGASLRTDSSLSCVSASPSSSSRWDSYLCGSPSLRFGSASESSASRPVKQGQLPKRPSCNRVTSFHQNFAKQEAETASAGWASWQGESSLVSGRGAIAAAAVAAVAVAGVSTVVYLCRKRD
ncbi:unnamed protein product [Closterium sp. Naga37s-1]|nr:unnamed protein product [Closterium sp. Naga37s-1]